MRRFTFRSHGPIALPSGEWAPKTVTPGWVADLNRHYWFATLGFAYWYSGDKRYLRGFVEQSSDWMDQYLGRLGSIEWDTPFEVASRINAWLWAHFLFLPAPDLDPSHCERLVRGLGLLAEYLNQTIEYHSPGNHILLEAKALLLCGEALPEFAGAAAWRQKGWRILEEELRMQVCDDGVHAERSTMYHRIVAGELTELWQFCKRNQSKHTAALEDVVRRMARFQTWLDQGGGHGDFPLFGDAQAEDTYYRFSAPAGVAAADATAYQDLITESSDHGYWLLGAEGARRSSHRPRQPESTGAAFRAGGYFIARSGWTPSDDVLVWDCGPAGYHRNRKHAHLDTLSFTLSVAGTPLLIDPAVHEGDQWGDRSEKPLRSTRAHTTVCLDGEEQGILAERQEIWSPPEAELLLWASSDQVTVMSGRHDGYRRLRSPAWHERTIIVMHGLYWLIVDSIEGSADHTIEQRFHVAPGSRVCGDNEHVELSKESVRLVLRWARQTSRLGITRTVAPAAIHVEPSLAELYSGRAEPSAIISAAYRGPVPVTLAVVASSAERLVQARWARETDASAVVAVSGEGIEDVVHVAWKEGAHLELPDGWTADARVAIVRQRAAAGRDLLVPAVARLWRNRGDDAVGGDLVGGTETMRRIVLPHVE